VVFRHRGLSDAIGFHCHAVPDPTDAARAFIAEIRRLARGVGGERDYLVPIILDGERVGKLSR
jgi:alpha-amylase/alpha-mannosidase (GH57 family)